MQHVYIDTSKSTENWGGGGGDTIVGENKEILEFGPFEKRPFENKVLDFNITTYKGLEKDAYFIGK